MSCSEMSAVFIARSFAAAMCCPICASDVVGVINPIAVAPKGFERKPGTESDLFPAAIGWVRNVGTSRRGSVNAQGGLHVLFGNVPAVGTFLEPRGFLQTPGIPSN